MARALDIGFPSRLGVVDTMCKRRREVPPTPAPNRLQKPVVRVQRFVAVAAISRDNQDLSAHGASIPGPGVEGQGPPC